MIGDDQSRREAARRHLAEGNPAEALTIYQESYLAARALPTVTGTGGSVWLSEWADLAHTYPPAQEALRRQRWAAVQRLRPGQDGTGGQPGGEPSRGLAALDDFTEVAAISARLHEPDYPVELFVDLDRQRPDVAEDCAALARRHLVRSGRFDLARRYLGDPRDVVPRAAAVFEQRLTRGFGHVPEDMRGALRASTVESYVSGVREILAVLVGVGEHELAEQIRRQAVDAVGWVHVREDVETALANRP